MKTQNHLAYPPPWPGLNQWQKKAIHQFGVDKACFLGDNGFNSKQHLISLKHLIIQLGYAPNEAVSKLERLVFPEGIQRLSRDQVEDKQFALLSTSFQTYAEAIIEGYEPGVLNRWQEQALQNLHQYGLTPAHFEGAYWLDSESKIDQLNYLICTLHYPPLAAVGASRHRPHALNPHQATLLEEFYSVGLRAADFFRADWPIDATQENELRQLIQGKLPQSAMHYSAKRVLEQNPLLFNNTKRLPEQYLDSSGTVTLSHLQGNAQTLLHFLLTHQIIQFKADIDAKSTYQSFVALYEEAGKSATKPEVAERSFYNSREDTKTLKFILDRYNELTTHGVRTIDEQLEFSSFTPEFIKNTRIAFNYAFQQYNNRLIEQETIIARFHQVINSLEIKNKHVAIRFIANTLASNGNNDYFTLALLDFLKKHHVNITTVVEPENAFIAMFNDLLNNDTSEPEGIFANNQQPSSFLGLKLFIYSDKINLEDVKQWVNNAYLPTLKLIDYNLFEESISLFSAKPLAYSHIQLLAKQLHVVYKDATKEELAATIDKINTQYVQNINMPKNITWDMSQEQPTQKNGFFIHYFDGDNLTNRQLIAKETNLNQRHSAALIEEEYKQADAIQPKIRRAVFTGSIAAAGLTVGVMIAIILVATGVFAPFGVGILGMVSLASILGSILMVAGAIAGISLSDNTAPFSIKSTVIPNNIIIEKDSINHLAALGGKPPKISTPFSQIHHNDFLNHTVLKADLKTIKNDFERNMNRIFIDDISFREIAIHYFSPTQLRDSINTLKQLPKNQSRSDDEWTNSALKILMKDDEIFLTVLRQFLFKNIPHDAAFETYFNKTLSILCQQGILFRGAETIKNTCLDMNLDFQVGEQDLCSTVNLLTRHNGIIIQESTQLMQVAANHQASSTLKETHVDPVSNRTILTNPDNSSMLDVTCQTHIKFSAGKALYKTTDLTLNYHNEQIKSLFDNRSILTKTSDFFNSFFHRNGLTQLDEANEAPNLTFH